MAYTLHWDEPWEKKKQKKEKEKTGTAASSSTHSASASSSSRHRDHDRPQWRHMSEKYDTSASESNATSSSIACAAASSSSSSSSSSTSPTPASEPTPPLAPEPDSILSLTGDTSKLESLLNDPDSISYQLPPPLIQLIIEYLSDNSIIDAIFNHSNCNFNRIGFVLNHAYSYAAIHSLPRPFTQKDARTYFLKGRDHDIFLALERACVGTKYAIEIVPVRVEFSGELYQPEWHPVKTPAEFQLLQVVEKLEKNKKEETGWRAREYAQLLQPSIYEILSFLPSGLIDKQTFLDDIHWLNDDYYASMILSQRAISSSHEADFDPSDSDPLLMDTSDKRAAFWGAGRGGSCTGNAGYGEQIELQYIAAAIVITHR